MKIAAEIRLEAFTPADADVLVGWVESARFLLMWAGPVFKHPLTREQLRLHSRQARGRKRRHHIFKAVECDSGRSVGHVEVCNVDLVNRCARLARVLVGPHELRGRGLGREIVRQALDFAFAELGLHRVSLGVFDFNAAAIRCYERCGFCSEGLARDARRFEDEYWSLHQMSILEDEWRRAREREL